MARKRSILFPSIQSILKSASLRKTYQKIGLIFLSLLTVISTSLVPALLSESVLGEESKPQQSSFLISQAENALALEQEAKEYYDSGRFAEASEVWQQAADAYAQNEEGKIRNLINKAEALQALGFSLKACDTLLKTFGIANPECLNLTRSNSTIQEDLNSQNQKSFIGNVDSLIETLKLQQDTLSLTKAIGLRSLGDVFRQIGDLKRSASVLKISLNIAQRLQSYQDIDASRLSLANTKQAQGDIGDLLNPLKVASEIVQLSVNDDLENTLNQRPIDNYLNDYLPALNLYKQLFATSKSNIIKIQSLLNQANLLLKIDRGVNNATEEATQKANQTPPRVKPFLQQVKSYLHQEIERLLPNIKELTANLPVSREAAYAKINLAYTFSKVVQTTGTNSALWRQEAANLLVNAVQQGRTLKDKRIETDALGYLGELYEQEAAEAKDESQKNILFATAQKLTEQALKLIMADTNTDNRDIAYRLEWQLGRILKAQEKDQEALGAYAAAFQKLKSLRSDFVAINRDVQFNFREQVEPVYRDYLKLLLTSKEYIKMNEKDKNENIKKAREVIEALQLAEIENYLQSLCSEIKSENLDNLVEKKAKTSAVIYPLIVADNNEGSKLEIIVKFPIPQSPLRRYSTLLPKDYQVKLDELYKVLYIDAVKIFDIQNIPQEEKIRRLEENKEQNLLPLLQEIYKWLITPIKADLDKSKVENLVFVLDSTLQYIPIAALYDNETEEYLIQKYSVALAPGLQLTDTKPFSGQIQALVAGAVKIPGKRSLSFVERELQQIYNLLGKRATLLKEQEFTKQKLRENLSKSLLNKPFSIVHLATHGQFSSKPEETYIDTIDGRINGNDLDRLLRSRTLASSDPLELLVLSACKTAEGDKRAFLGLAGIAVGAGARSTLGTLWNVDDESTSELMSMFYRNLIASNTTKKISKAEALRSAQVELLKNPNYKHPAYWAAYVLVGNWL